MTLLDTDLRAAAARAVAAAPERVIVSVSTTDEGLCLDLVFVPPELRGRGLGTAAVSAVVAVADDLGVRLDAWPDAGFGSDLLRLVRWYLSFGFQAAGNSPVKMSRG